MRIQVYVEPYKNAEKTRKSHYPSEREARPSPLHNRDILHLYCQVNKSLGRHYVSHFKVQILCVHFASVCSCYLAKIWCTN